jgi:Tfp pilus assembly protein FimV
MEIVMPPSTAMLYRLVLSVCLLAATPARAASESEVDAALMALFADRSIIDGHLLQRHGSELLNGRYEVRPGDTLDGIISLAFPETAIRKSVLRQAFIERNPAAFRGTNPNWLLAGASLTIPVAEDIHSLLFTNYSVVRERYPADTSGWVQFP